MGEIRILEGIARKISCLFLTLSFIGWIVFVIGFAQEIIEIRKVDSSYNPLDEPDLYPFWAASVVGLFLHILAVVHTFLWGLPSSLAGGLTAVLSIMYFTAIGAVMISYGIVLRKYEGHLDLLEPLKNTVILYFSGGLVTATFWALHMALWACFRKDPEKERDYSTF